MDAITGVGDVSVDADCRRLAAQADKRWGRIDALVNSAGTTRFVPMADLDALTAEDFERVIAVNTVGPFQMVRAVAPIMRRTGGAVVNISSVAGMNGTGSSYAYAASKGALNTITFALARNLAPGNPGQRRIAGNGRRTLAEGRVGRSRLSEGAFRRGCRAREPSPRRSKSPRRSDG